MNRIPDCRLRSAIVEQMGLGEAGRVPLWALWADAANRARLAPHAPIDEGPVLVSADADGLHVDLSKAPVDYRFRRVRPGVGVPVATVTGALCVGA